jgi:TRAP-type uncharacterized transport system fused permease subunit
MFVFSPTLLMVGDPTKVVWDMVTALIGVYYVTVAIVGFFQREVNYLFRAVMLVSGAVALVPDASVGLVIPGFLSATGVIVGGAFLGWEYIARRRAGLARDPAE